MSRLYDVFDPEFHDDPFPVYTRLRDDFPAYRDDELGFWALSRFDDVFTAATDPETFSSYAIEAEALLPQLNFLDGARHRELRRVGFPRLHAASRCGPRASRRRRGPRTPRRHRTGEVVVILSPTSARPSRAGLSVH